jgi:hypothetical protein
VYRSEGWHIETRREELTGLIKVIKVQYSSLVSKLVGGI